MERGDIYMADLKPTFGQEQAGQRPVIVLTVRAFNAKNAAIVCPITSGGEAARLQGFAVSLSGTGLRTTGAVLCHQVRVLDLIARRARKIERAPDVVIDEVMAKVAAILS